VKKYEALYIVDSKLSDEDIQKIVDRYKGVVEAEKGAVSYAGKWEKRKLAYEIDGHKDGNYIIMQFESNTSVPQELNRLMRISDDVIRHRVFLQGDNELMTAPAGAKTE
jgi:small subunit ribosomal protein S6